MKSSTRPMSFLFSVKLPIRKTSQRQQRNTRNMHAYLSGVSPRMRNHTSPKPTYRKFKHFIHHYCLTNGVNVNFLSENPIYRKLQLSLRLMRHIIAMKITQKMQLESLWMKNYNAFFFKFFTVWYLLPLYL